MNTIRISCAYANRENNVFGTVLEWVYSYCKRNKISRREYDQNMDKFHDGPTERYLELNFKSQHQLNCFVRRGNYFFPYFEFR